MLIKCSSLKIKQFWLYNENRPETLTRTKHEPKPQAEGTRPQYSPSSSSWYLPVPIKYFVTQDIWNPCQNNAADPPTSPVNYNCSRPKYKWLWVSCVFALFFLYFKMQFLYGPTTPIQRKKIKNCAILAQHPSLNLRNYSLENHLILPSTPPNLENGPHTAVLTCEAKEQTKASPRQ